MIDNIDMAFIKKESLGLRPDIIPSKKNDNPIKKIFGQNIPMRKTKKR